MNITKYSNIFSTFRQNSVKNFNTKIIKNNLKKISIYLVYLQGYNPFSLLIGGDLMQSIKNNELLRFIGFTLFYFIILVLLFIIHGFHDMNAGPFIYTEF